MKKIKLLIKLLFIPLAFYIIFQKIDINQLKEIKFIHPLFLLLAFIFYNLSQITSALRIQNYLKHIKITPSFKNQLILYYLGMFYNTLLPGGIGGDAYKAYKFQKSYEVGYKKIIKGLLVDRISGLFAIIFLILAIFPFSVLNEKLSIPFFFFYISLFLFFILITFFHKYFFPEFHNSFLKNFIFSLFIQLLQLFAFISILFSIGINSHFIDFSILFFISSILSVLPVSIGGVGLRELTFLYGLEYLHLNPTTGVVGAFLFFLISLLSSLIGIIFIKKEIDV
ncbi:lysylphosphatidylglycerol synthase transmembrane domain-containing protein [Caminibacter sp.]